MHRAARRAARPGRPDERRPRRGPSRRAGLRTHRHAGIPAALADPAVVGGRFDLRLDDRAPLLRLIGWLISTRSRLSRTGTGDQAIFVRREIFFERLGGYRNIELCEDLDLARRLKRAGRVACLRSCVVSSARRWRRGGVLATVARMWLIRAAFLLGVSPARLAHLYNRGGPVENESTR